MTPNNNGNDINNHGQLIGILLIGGGCGWAIIFIVAAIVIAAVTP